MTATAQTQPAVQAAPAPAPAPPPERGLTAAEVAERRARGQVNAAPPGTGRTYLDILRTNLFTFINIVLFAIGIVLVLVGRPDDAFLTAGLVLINVVVGVVQEARAKSKLDRIALLTRPRACVLRDGVEEQIDPSSIVLDDVLVLRPGDQIVVDGEVVGEGRADVDESLLTGESDLIPKQAGDPVYSGSYVVNGTVRYVARKVGSGSFANQITAGARAFRQVKTPLQRDVDFVIRMLILLVTVLGIMMATAFLRQSYDFDKSVQAAAVIVSLVPQGLFFMVTIAYAVGAVRMSGRGALIQQSNAVESLSNVRVLCLDKTGTLTTNAIRLEQVVPLAGATEQWARSVLGDYAANTSAGNKTSSAIAAGLPGNPRKVAEEVPFSSERKWSALSFDDPDLKGTFVLGAPEMVKPGVSPEQQEAWAAQSAEWVERGLRVLLFAYRPDVVPMSDSEGNATLPQGMTPLAVISFSDELRPEAQNTIDGFNKAGIALKIISGDNPNTVAALARQAGFQGDIQVVSGLELEGMDDVELARVAEESTVFGRITPQQKEKLVQCLKKRGHYVAMIGDGVNDVLSLKQAHVGIAMQSGSPATRGVADLVLLNDSFGVLPGAFQEGQRIINGMYDVVRLLLTRTLYQVFLIVGAAMIQLPFPLSPKHNSIIALLTVGIPTIALVAWARPGQPPARLIRAISHFVVPASLTMAFVGLEVYLGFVAITNDVALAQTAMTVALTLCGILLIVFVEPPSAWWVGGDEYSGDKRPIILAGFMLAALLTVIAIPQARDFFELTLLGPVESVIVVAVTLLWGFALRMIWRGRLLERLAGEDA
ncbi:MAG TPA: HAD-IC family P-type ATPase [Chloroflexia bacterium]|nr:HAD-IC family P-type ATPase [Chloroflexia bacterium]